MNDCVLRIENVGKAYRIHESAGSRFLSWFGVPTPRAEERWVLRNVSINVARGEAVGIVGQNGAGKSTLLKLVTGTANATEGSLHRSGRIAAILELGLGFLPELTGRENARHALRLMGLGAAATERLLPEIEDFAEIGEYFDRPLRIYSSGMQVRVAFAVVTAFRPDVLIIDEALSVGDAYFQHKSFEKIREFQNQGTSLLIVSHDRTAIQALCSRAVLLEGGVVVRDGDPSEIMDYYNALIAEKEAGTVREGRLASGRLQVSSGTGEAQVGSIGLYDATGQATEHVNVGQAIELRIDVAVHAPIPRLVLGYMIKDRIGLPVYGTNTHHTDQGLVQVAPGTIRFAIRFPMNLGPGSYSVSTALVSTDTHLVNNYEWRDLALVFTVGNADKPSFVGTAWIPPVIEIASP